MILPNTAKPDDVNKAKSANRVTLEEAKEKITSLQKNQLVYISPGLLALIGAGEPNENASVFEAHL